MSIEQEVGAASADHVGDAVVIDVHQARVARGKPHAGTRRKHHGLGVEAAFAVGFKDQLQRLIDGEEIHASVAVQVGQRDVAAVESDGRGHARNGRRAFQAALAGVAPEVHARAAGLENVGQAVARHVDKLCAGIAQRRAVRWSIRFDGRARR